jgi:hypothetical protein
MGVRTVDFVGGMYLGPCYHEIVLLFCGWNFKKSQTEKEAILRLFKYTEETNIAFEICVNVQLRKNVIPICVSI